MNYIKIILLLVFFTGSNTLLAQFTQDYTPVKYSSSGFKMSENAFHKKMKFKYNMNDANLIKKFDKYLYVLYRGYVNGSKEKQYIEDPFMKKYLRTILDTVLARNGMMEKFDIVCTRYVVPNAFNMGDNKLYVNIGILEQLKNESQLAFLLCHELSHQLLFHVQDNFIANDKLSKDKTVKKEIRNINKAKYNKLDKTFQFLKNYNYDFAKYSRAHEKSADSMAIVLLKKTDYDLKEGKSLMEILDHSDKDSNKVDYKKYFDNNTNSYKTDWLESKKNRISFGNKSEMEFDKDSIKTHPDIPNRIKMIDTQLTLINYSSAGKKVFMQSEAAFDSIANMSKFEIIESYLKRKRYSAVVYHSFVLLSQYPDNKYLYKNIATSLHELNKAIKKHTIQNFIPIESEEDFSEGYNHFLRIIDRATAVEFETLVKNFITQYYSRINSYSEIQSIYNEYTKK